MSGERNGKSGQVFSQLAEEADALGKRIEKYTQMEQDLQNLPLPREDFAQQLGKWVDHEAERFPAMLAKAVSPLVEQPYFDPTAIELHLTGDGHDQIPDAERMQVMMAYLFRDRLKEALQQAVTTLNWPRKVGPPRMRRDQMVANIHTKLEGLRVKEGELMSLARDMLRRLEGERDGGDSPAMSSSDKVSCPVVPVAESAPPTSQELSDEERLLLDSLQSDKVVEMPGRRRTGTG